jgi:polysaccharide deacetylase family protein (PEP-CTERM system associated)
MTPQPQKKHILTVSVEDYFHVGAFEGSVLRKHWERFESRLEDNIGKVLELMARHNAQATFFVFGWIAERQPQIIRRIVAAGHEVASSGYWPKDLRGTHPEDLRADMRRAKAALEEAGSGKIIGYRAARNWLKPPDLWVLDMLAEEGYLYDSSLNPIFRRYAHDPRRIEVHKHRHTSGTQTIWEFPVSTTQVLGMRVTISGGNYIRQLPHPLLRRAVAHWDATRQSPLVFYFMPWEMDKDQPFISSLPRLTRIRHYRNLAKTAWVMEEYLKTYAFQSIRSHLGVPVDQAAASASQLPVELAPSAARKVDASLPQVTLVVPLFNEEQTVTYMMRTIQEFRRHLESSYRIHLILVDDGSSDKTWPRLEALVRDVEDCTLLRHEVNRGVAAAILTGVRSAPTETVCSIDCDCSYDPIVLETMIPMLESADMVTASPYHPQGEVFNVPSWRLFLSKTLCLMYSQLLGQRIHTFTSCCRVYRKTALEGLNLEYRGFLGVAEMLIRLQLRGGRIRECPAILESRLFGESKMKIYRTIISHLKFIARLMGEKVTGKGRRDLKKQGSGGPGSPSTGAKLGAAVADASAMMLILGSSCLEKITEYIPGLG